MPIFGDGSNIRDWIHVTDHCRGLLRVLQQGTNGSIYNIGANNERSNLEIVTQILDILEKPTELISFVSDRLGHDWRYAIDSSRIQNELHWDAQIDFTSGLRQTINWYRQNPQWLTTT